MRQETGSNPIKHNDIVSIRVTSSGHNFSQHNPIPTGEFSIVIESSKAMLLPTTLLSEDTLQGHLLSAGIAMNDSLEEVIIVEHSESIIALIVVPKSLHNDIQSTCADRVHITTPLLAPPPSNGHDVLIHLSADRGLMCLNLYNGRDLVFAELFEIKSYADILYWLTRLGGGYDLSKYTIYIDGGDSELKQLLQKYYKRVTLCE